MKKTQHTSRSSKHSRSDMKLKSRSEEDLFEILDNTISDPFVVILDQIQDPHNLGAILRSADAAGVHAVIAPRDRSVSLTKTVREIACGGAEGVPFIQVTNLVRTMKELKDYGLWLVGTTDKASQLLYDIELSGPIAIVMGSEGKGLRRLTSEKCDFLAKIPMAGRSVDCLNVSVATGVCLFETVRQRSLKK